MNETERFTLIQRAVEGDGDALQQLIIYYHGPLYGIIEGRMDAALRRYVGPEDILQQAYIAAFGSIRQCNFDGPGRFYKWLERIALDRLMKVERDLRRKKRDIGRQVDIPSTDSSSTHFDLLKRMTNDDPTPSRHLAKREASAAVLSSMARLTEDQRSVVRMRFLEDQPVSEIAAKLSKSEPAIHMLSFRGLKSLRQWLGSITHYMSHSR